MNKISDADLRAKVITGLFRALNTMGYQDCTEDNVLTDGCFGMIATMIILDLHRKATAIQAQRVAEALLEEIEANMDKVIDSALEASV